MSAEGCVETRSAVCEDTFVSVLGSLLLQQCVSCPCLGLKECPLKG